MTKRCKRLITGTMIAILLISIGALAASLYLNAVLSFTGIQLVTNNSTTQGFVDITLKNINTTGISFCIEYDKNLVELSNVSDNVPIQNPVSTDPNEKLFNIDHKYFEQNTEAFPDGSFRDIQIQQAVELNLPIIGIADADTGHLIMNFLPEENSVSNSDYLDMITEDGHTRAGIIANTSNGVRLGRLSFNIKDPTAFSRLSQEELNNAIKIVPFSSMPGGPVMQADDTGVYLMYLNEDGKLKWYTNPTQNIKYEFDLKPDLIDVKPQVDEISVSSYEIYKNGTIDDLFDYINEKMSLLTLFYADNSQVPAVFEWKQGSSTGVGTWDPKGGDYTITQQYNDNFSVSVTVHVLPVKLIDFDVENEEITYSADDSSNFPTTFDDLKLAKKMRPVLDTYIPNGGLAEFDIDWYSYEGNAIQDLPATFDISNVPSGFTFEGHSDACGSLATNYPWLTTDNPLPDITMVRNIVATSADIPKGLKVISAVTDDNGVLTIHVQNVNGDPILTGTTFNIKMPGGELINTSALSSYNVTFNSDGSVDIVIDADINVAAEEKLAKVINLGDRAGGAFSIASTEPGKGIGPYTDFTPNSRRNIYTGASSDYVFDYSGNLAAMFPVKVGTTLPKTITLPLVSDRIYTTYSGYDGSEPGKLATITVDDWNFTGDTTTVGSIITAVGRLSKKSYTNYGEVYNDNNVDVTIKYYVVADKGIESVGDIDYFKYNLQQVGYDYNHLQTHTFTVTNTGATDIYGLSAVISLGHADADGNDRESFVMTKALPIILASGSSADLDISTRIGLPIGNYVSTVSIMSNNTVLKTFNISFEVTDQVVCTVVVEVPDSEKEYGTVGSNGNQTETYTSVVGGQITITAVPEDDCKFTGWFITQSAGVLQFTDTEKNQTPLTFTIPEGETCVKIYAHFEETFAAKLRLSELKVTDTESPYNSYNLNKLSATGQWEGIAFDPVMREYYVAVPNDTENVMLWFKLRSDAPQGVTLDLSHEHDSVTDSNLTINYDSNDLYYKTQDISLDVSPVDNIITLTLTADDPNDVPDAGDISREYKIHVYRKLKLSDLMVFDYGNSPYGLIMRDGTISDKTTAKQTFVNNENTFISGNTPQGGTVGVTYTDKAWDGVNYDLDDSALFVINSSPFTDPGYKSVTNSIGAAVDGGSITKKVNVNILANSTSSLQTGSPGDYVTITSQSVTLPTTGQITELQGLRIRPDRYELIYSFTDFDGQTVSISKPLIVLSPLGDVNADKTADETDSSRIIHRFEEDMDLADNLNVPDYAKGGLLNKYRVCDVNKDGNVNAIDANHVRANDIIPFYTN